MSEDPLDVILSEIAQSQAARALRDLEDVDPPALSNHRRLRVEQALRHIKTAERLGATDVEGLDAHLDEIRRRMVQPGDDEGLWNLSLSMNQLRLVTEALLETDMRRRIQLIAPHLAYS